MILCIIDDTPGVNTKQLFVIEGGRMSLRIGKRIGEESRCYTAIPGRGIDEEGYRGWRRFITTLLQLLN
jgi:hypothetical protein